MVDTACREEDNSIGLLVSDASITSVPVYPLTHFVSEIYIISNRPLNFLGLTFHAVMLECHPCEMLGPSLHVLEAAGLGASPLCLSGIARLHRL